MENPFLKRATEFFRDEEAFLAVLSPEPVRFFLQREAKRSTLYDKLVNIRGTPGSGKTTLARIFEYPTLTAVLRNKSAHEALLDTLVQCGAIVDEVPTVLASRLALESDYREIWEFPYPEHTKLALTQTLIQARAILMWMRHLGTAGIASADVEVQSRPDAEAALESIGGSSGAGLLQRARLIERALYKVVGSLVPPPLEELGAEITDAYRPFDVIERVAIRRDEQMHLLRPLVILDDAHILAPAQFRGVQRFLIRRELRVARWVLARLDVLHPTEAFEALTDDSPPDAPLPGVTASREYVSIMLQSSLDDRRRQRLAFRRMASDMASRYLRQMPLFSARNLHSLEELLGDSVPSLPKAKLVDLAKLVDSAQERLGISSARRQEVDEAVGAYVPQGMSVLPEDIRLAMISVVLHRMEKRGQVGLFDRGEPEPPSRIPKVDVGVFDAARIHLLHRYNKPYYFSINDVCDASSENAEQFLRLSARLVEVAAANVIRGKPALLDPATQDRLLRDRAAEVLNGWDFPLARVVRRITEAVAERCLMRSLEPNASLGAGANAYAILQEEFESIPDSHPVLAQALQSAIANNAFTVVPHHSCKNKEWCLLELGGTVILRHGLTLKRGGFLEGTAMELAALSREPA